MKIFSSNGYYSLTVFHITKAPVVFDACSAVNIGRDICEDTYYLSDGSGKVSVEFLRISGAGYGMPICHLLIVRCYDRDKSIMTQLTGAVSAAVRERFSLYGYQYSEVNFDFFLRMLDAVNGSSVWAVTKEELRHADRSSPNVYVSLPVISDEVDMSGVYKALESSRCALSVQITADTVTAGEREAIQQMYGDLSRAADGSFSVIPAQMPKDNLAVIPRVRWEQMLSDSAGPTATVNIVVYGPAESAAVVIARLRGCITDKHTKTAAALRAFDIKSSSASAAVYNSPWRIEQAVADCCRAARFSLAGSADTRCLIRKMSSPEAGAILSFPVCNDNYAGIGCNAFSLLGQGVMLPESMKKSRGAINIGRSEGSGPVFITGEDMLLHMAVYGKTGTGKSTLLLNIIDQLAAEGVSVLAIEPVKREYRKLIRGSGEVRVYTAGSTVSPFILNPFQVPGGITLGQYRPHLVRAFSAAFSMPDPLPSLFGAAITEAYAQYGWKDNSKASDPDVKPFGLWEFVRVFRRALQNSNYSAEIKGNMTSGGTYRLLSLIDKCKNTFESINSIPVEDIFSGNVVLELGRLEGEQKCLVAALTLISVLSLLRATGESGSVLKNVILLDEAHVLLDNGRSATEEGQAANETMELLISNFIAEMRAYGVGIIIADQSPARIGENLMNNTDTKVIFRLTGTEARKVSEGIGLSAKESAILPLLDKGEAIVTNRLLRSPIGIRTNNRAWQDPVSDDELAENGKDYNTGRAKLFRPFAECGLCGTCSDRCDDSTRDAASMLSINMYTERQEHLKNAKSLAEHLLFVPASLTRQGYPNDSSYHRLCNCVALHIYRKAALSSEFSLSDGSLRAILSKITQYTEEGHGI